MFKKLKTSKNDLQEQFSAKGIIEVFLLILFIVCLLKCFVLDFFVVKSNSMFPTLQVGDKVLLTRLYYFIGLPERLPVFNIELSKNLRYWFKNVSKNDVVVFYKPSDNEKIFVKRIKGLPGDMVQIRDLPIGERFQLLDIDRKLIANSSIAVIPNSGSVIDLNIQNISLYKSAIENEGHKVEISTYGTIKINGKEQYQFKFSNDYFFVMGDNSNNSKDSRYFGLVSKSEIIGKPLIIYWSNDNKKINSSRILETIN